MRVWLKQRKLLSESKSTCIVTEIDILPEFCLCNFCISSRVACLSEIQDFLTCHKVSQLNVSQSSDG